MNDSLRELVRMGHGLVFQTVGPAYQTEPSGNRKRNQQEYIASDHILSSPRILGMSLSSFKWLRPIHCGQSHRFFPHRQTSFLGKLLPPKHPGLSPGLPFLSPGGFNPPDRRPVLPTVGFFLQPPPAGFLQPLTSLSRPSIVDSSSSTRAGHSACTSKWWCS